MHRHRRKHRFSTRHALLALAPLMASYLVAAERVTLGQSLDLLWLLLTVSAVIHCLQQRAARASRAPQLLSLALVLALVFPVISLDDERAQEELPRELQTLLSAPAKQKQVQVHVAAHAPSVAVVPQFTVWLDASTEPVAPVLPITRHSAWRQSSGNHSPPLA